MKHIRVFAGAVCLLAGFAGSGTIFGQDHAARATVPFDFNVGDVWVPAGVYVISSDMTNPRVISLHSQDGRVSVLSLTRAEDQRSNGDKLVFTKYGDQYFLHEVLCSVCGLNLAFPGSKHEKIARRRLEAGLLTKSNVYLAVR